MICDNDELFNELIDQLELDITEGKYNIIFDDNISFVELIYVYKLKLKEYWTNILITFNEIISEIDVYQVKEVFEDDKIIVEMLSVRIDMVSREPEYKTSKKSIKKLLQKHNHQLKRANF